MSTTIIERFRLAQAKNKEYITSLREHIDTLTTQLDAANGQIAFYMNLPKSNPDEILAITEQNQMQLKTIAEMQVKLDENAAKLKEEEAQLEAMAKEEESMSLEATVETPVEVAPVVEAAPVVETPVEITPVVETPTVETTPEVVVEAVPVVETAVEVPVEITPVEVPLIEIPVEAPIEVAPPVVEVEAPIEVAPVVEAAPAVEGVKVDEVTPSALSTKSTTVIDSVPSLDGVAVPLATAVDTDPAVKNLQVNTSDNILAAPIEVHQVETPVVDSSATVGLDVSDQQPQ